MNNLKITQAEQALSKIVDNLLNYTDEVVAELKPLAKNGVIDINKWDTFAIIDMAYMTNHHQRVFGSFNKDFIYQLFYKGILTNDLKRDIDKSIQMQLLQSTL
jgi:hypothetical protein